MKKLITVLALATSIYEVSANLVEENNSEILIEETSCTVEYTNSRRIKFTSTAKTCDQAYQNISSHIEASEPKKQENKLSEFNF